MSGDLSGFSMFELFKEEAASNAAALSEGLLTIEAHPNDTSHVEKLMRAAHSIKGAARIVGLDTIVQLAHAMEDRFLAVQRNEEQLTPARVDQLLRGVDVFQELAEMDEANLDQWMAQKEQECIALSESLAAPLTTQPTSQDEPPVPTESVESSTPAATPAPSVSPQPPPESPEEATPPEPTPAQPAAPVPDQPAKPIESSAPAQRTSDPRTVPVAAASLNRIMRLASESMVESRRLQSMRESLAAMVDSRRRFTDLLERLERAHRTGESTSSLFEDAKRLNNRSADLLKKHGETLERTLWQAERTSTQLYHQVIGSRMRPFAEATQPFPRMIRDLARSLGKQVIFEIRGESVAVDRDILRKLEAPLNHILRNAVDHAIETPDLRQAAGKPESGRVVVEARHHAGMLMVEVRDDGRGMDVEDLRRKIVERRLHDQATADRLEPEEIFEFLFLPGFSTAKQVTEVSGRGVGLDVVRTMVQEVSGTVRIESTLGRGTTFTLRLPVTLSVVRAAIATIAGELYAFPLAKLVRIVRVPTEDIQPVQGRLQFALDGQSVGLIRASEVLDLPEESQASESASVIVIGESQQLCGIAVDQFVGEQDLVVRPLDARLGKVAHLAAAALTEEGQPLLVVDVDDLLQSIRQRLGEGRLHGMRSVFDKHAPKRTKILVVDDSITVREVVRQLLISHGYDVDVAVDGQNGWQMLSQGAYDLLITDIDMPRMNGIELIQTVRRESRFAELPIVIVSYKDRESDRLRGFDAGANAYLTKGSFHDDSFVRTVCDLVGEAN